MYILLQNKSRKMNVGILLSLILMNALSAVSIDLCPIGDDSISDTSPLSPAPSGVFYWSEAIAVDSCTGNISRVRYCYHHSQTLAPNLATARFSLYRISESRFSYNRVSPVFNIANRIPFDSSAEEFVCEYLDLGTTLEVQDRDLFGVCFPDVPEEQRLQIVSEDPDDGILMGSIPCEGQPVDSFLRFSLTTTIVRDARLHLFADSDSEATIPDDNTVTTELPTTELPTTQSPTTELPTTELPTTELLTTELPTTELLTTELSTTELPTVQSPTTAGTRFPARGPADTTPTTEHTTGGRAETMPTSSVTTSGIQQDDGLTPVEDGSDIPDINRTIAVGVAVAVFLGILVAVIVSVAVLVAWKKRKQVYTMKTRSGLAINSFPPTTIDNIAFPLYDYIDGEERGNGTYEEAIPTTQHTGPTGSSRSARARKPSRGKNSEGYYCPDAVTYSELMPQEEETRSRRNCNPYEAPANKENELYAQLRHYGITKISRNELEAKEHLGSGQFGTVERGLWRRDGKVMEVAVKTLKMPAVGNGPSKLKLLQEAVIMAQFQHPNVLFLCGVARQEETIMLVTELAHRGDLREYLLDMNSKQEPVTPAALLPQLLLSFSLHIAHGMEYLSSKGFIHRDLAARNILVTESNICKVADFGMSRDLVDGTYYVASGGRVPLKWTAPESLHYHKYSTASDVWSYGCLLYEIWSLGTKPFSQMRNEDVIEFIDAGKRMTPPPGTPRKIYQMMTACWHPDKASRPGFRDIITSLQESDGQVLLIPSKDKSSHPQASVLGGPLQAGRGMYPDLCTQYSRYSTTADDHHDTVENTYDVLEGDLP